MKRLMVPFFVALLLGSVLMVPLSPVVAAPAEPTLIAGDELINYPEPDWGAFWAKFNQYSQWDLEYYNGAQWISEKQDLQIIRDYPEPNKVKLTLVFDASHAANYRLTFAIDERVKNYTTRLDQYAYELNYMNYSLVWDWSDAIGIPGLVFTHGLLNDMFWFRMRRDNVPLGAHVEIDPTLIAEYNLGNVDGYLANNDHHPSDSIYQSAGAMSFQTPGTNRVLYAVDFRLGKIGNPTGNATAQIFAHTGTFGTTSRPTGAALATSDNFTVSTLGGATTVRFFFTGANQITLLATTYYCVAYVNPVAGTINTSNYVLLGSDSTPAAAGNAARYINGAWAVYTTRDVCFALWGTAAPTIVDTVATTAFSQGIPGWVNVTVQEDKGIANLNYVEIFCNTTGAENFTLRWTQATDLFTEVSDPDEICFPDITGGSVREDVNATATKICYLFALGSLTTEGDIDVDVTVVNDDALTDTGAYPALFSYVGIEWNLVADLINSAFSLFGIMGYMTQITAFITSISGQFLNSLIQLATLINLQFQVIWAVFAWWLGWANRIIAAVLNFGSQLQMILNGTHPLLAGPVDLWNYFNFVSAGQAAFDVAPLFFIVYWINSMGKRARTQGSLQVLYGDLSSFANVFAYFMGAFGTVISFIESKISWLISALP